MMLIQKALNQRMLKINFNYMSAIQIVLAMFLLNFLIACTDQSSNIPLTSSDYPESETEQAVLYITKCGECHAAPLPKIHTAKQWPGVVQRMQFRMTSKAMPGLNEYDKAAIIGYLQKHAKQN